jgi:RHS repeat-associated protein
LPFFRVEDLAMSARRQRKTRTLARKIRLFLEPLEDRVLLSLLGLAQQGAKPDITSGIINDLSYTQQGNNANPFHYDSVPLWITLPDGSVDYINNPSDGSNATTNLDLLLSNQGYLEPGNGNSFSVTGNVTIGNQTYDGTLLTAQPQAFGYGDTSIPSGQGEFEVKLQITGGQLAAPSNAAPNPFRVGDELGVLIHQPGLPINQFPQTFSFSTLQNGVFDGTSDTLNIPAVPPATAPNTSCGCGTPPGNNLSQQNANAGGNVQPNTSSSGVNYFDGVAQISAANTALSSDGFDPWGQIVNWSNGSGYAPNGVNGNGTVDTTMPYLLPVNGPGTIAEVANGNTAQYFDLSGGTYQSRFFDQSTLFYNSNTNQYTLTDEMGDQIRFWGFDPSIPLAQQGQFVSFTDPAGNVTSVTSYTPSGQIAEVQRSTSAGGKTITESWLYSYITSGVNTGLLQNVTLERQTSGGPVDVVRQAVYTYYDGTQSFGLPGDLMLAQVENASGQVIDTSYYRYYTEDDAGTTGYIQGLKYYFSTDSYARLTAAVGNPLTASDAQVAPYADNYFQYDSQQRVSEAVVQGQGCSSCSGGLGTYTYSYTTSNNPDGYNSWAVKTVETLPDGNENIVYSNFAGEQMLSVFVDTTTNQQWETFYQYDSQGRVILMANPSAVTGYDDSHADLLNNQNGHYQYLSDNSGLITRYDYYTTTTAGETTPGGVAGYQQDTQIEHGQLGTPILQESMQYYAHSANGITVDPLANDTVYRNTDGTGAETTTYTYDWYPGTVQMQSMTTSLPVISAAQNGPGTPDVTTYTYDIYGRQLQTTDPDGFVSKTVYDPGTGAVILTEQDVGGLNLVTSYQVDDLGRTIEETSPNGNVTYTVYDDPNHEYRVYRGWNTATEMPTGPTEVYRYDLPGSYTETLTMSATPHVTNGVPDGSEAISDIHTLTRDYYNAAGQLVETDDYFNLNGVTYSPSPHLGTEGVNYYATQYGYDDRGRQDRVQDPTGTITRTVYDGLGRVVSTWVGTNDTPADGQEWSPNDNTPPANMVETTANVYDNGGVGDSNLTQMTQFPGGGAAPRVTQYFYDWRDRQVAEKDGVQANENDGTHRPIYYTTYDNLSEATSQAQYDGDGVTINTVNGVPQPPDPSLWRAYTTTEYDDQGRVFRTHTYDVNQTTGAISTNSLTTNYYYDHRGDQIAESDPGGLWTKTQYDGAGRSSVNYTTDGASGTDWNAANTVSGDHVLEQVQTIYDADSNVIETIYSQRFHNDTGTGPLGDPTSGVEARVYYTTNYYDAADRLTTSVDVGTNGGTAYTRPNTPPARSDTALVTDYVYDAAGRVQDVVDPRGLKTRTLYDALGRTTTTIQNYTNGVPTNNTNGTTNYTFDGDNHVLTQTAVQPAGTPSQTTEYVYGVTMTDGSAIHSNDLLAATIYPDPTTGQPSSNPNQHVTYTYNALGQVTSMTDRNGTTHQYSYDVLGRLTSDTVTQLGAGVDGSIRRIDTAYDTAGRPYLYTSYGDTAGSQTANQVEQTYDGLGQLTNEYQSHSGAVIPSTTPQVQYQYNELSNGANNSRLESMTYPNGRVLNYNYNTGLDDSISRLSSLSDSSGVLESYTYLGLNTVVQRAHPQTGVNLTYISPNGSTGDAGDQYTGLDRFGRVADQLWLNSHTNSATDEFQYTYDRDSNVLTRNNTVNSAFSEQYNYDGFNQLISFSRTNGHSQSWNLDARGNWTSVTTDGNTQTRTANAQNQYTSVSGGNTPTYDNNGNLTTDPTNGNTYVYDAWNRLVAVKNGGNTLANYTYDALGRRQTETEGGTTRHLYYDTSWQVVEERLGSATGATAQYIWNPTSQDVLILRDRDPSGGTNLSERLFTLQDADSNVTALVNTSGTVVERYVYAPYGVSTVLDANWNVRNSSSYSWVYLHQGLRQDAATGLIDNRERWYSPTLGNYLTEDPSGYSGGYMNLYVYQGDRPINSSDPLGLKVQFTNNGKTFDDAEALKEFFAALLTSYPQCRSVLDALQKDPDFKQIMDWLFKQPETVELKLVPELKVGGREVFGATEPDGSEISINTKHRKCIDNCLYVAETIIHESLHAAVALANIKMFDPAKFESVKRPTPNFLTGITDLNNDPTWEALKKKYGTLARDFGLLNKGDMTRADFAKRYPDVVAYLDKNYPSNDRGTGYSDLNFEGNKKIVSILDKILKDPAVIKSKCARKTSTFGFVQGK